MKGLREVQWGGNGVLGLGGGTCIGRCLGWAYQRSFTTLNFMLRYVTLYYWCIIFSTQPTALSGVYTIQSHGRHGMGLVFESQSLALPRAT